jgi:hypothetical protein
LHSHQIILPADVAGQRQGSAPPLSHCRKHHDHIWQFHLGMGDKLDEKNATALEPGGFESMPANTNHYAWTTAAYSILRTVPGRGFG